MIVTNRAAFPVIAFGIAKDSGYGPDIVIQPGEAKKVVGPYLGPMGGGECYHAMEVPDIACVDGPDESDGGNSFHIGLGEPIRLETENFGVTVRHYEDAVERFVQDWREVNPAPPYQES